jgi:hypothetical protein
LGNFTLYISATTLLGCLNGSQMKGFGATMDFYKYVPANEEELQQWNDMIDRMGISEQLQLLCEGVTLATTVIDTVSELGYRLVAAEEADVLNEDQLSQWEEAQMGFHALVQLFAMAVQEQE